jgi:hypothetical protein
LGFCAASLAAKKNDSYPKALRPDFVGTLDQMIALRFAGGNEDHFDAQVQSQSEDLAQHGLVAPQPGKSGVVIEVQKIGQAQLRERVQQMLIGRSGGLLRVQTSGDAIGQFAQSGVSMAH